MDYQAEIKRLEWMQDEIELLLIKKLGRKFNLEIRAGETYGKPWVTFF
jgi:hypothetical protein